MLSKFGSIRDAQQGTIDSQYVQTLPGIAVVALATPLATRLAEQPLHRIGPVVCAPPYTASGQQVVRSQALSADVQAPRYFMDWLVAKQNHAKHQPEHLIAGQSPPDGGLGGEVQRGRDPLDWNVLSEGAQIGEVEQFTQVEQLLLERHKKSDARSLASDFGEAPLGLKCLSEQHLRLLAGFYCFTDTSRS